MRRESACARRKNEACDPVEVPFQRGSFTQRCGRVAWIVRRTRIISPRRRTRTFLAPGCLQPLMAAAPDRSLYAADVVDIERLLDRVAARFSGSVKTALLSLGSVLRGLTGLPAATAVEEGGAASSASAPAPAAGGGSAGGSNAQSSGRGGKRNKHRGRGRRGQGSNNNGHESALDREERLNRMRESDERDMGYA
jgi:hypothetical protein